MKKLLAITLLVTISIPCLAATTEAATTPEQTMMMPMECNRAQELGWTNPNWNYFCARAIMNSPGPWDNPWDN